MHQYQQEAIAIQRVQARLAEAAARRQRKAAKRVRRRSWFGRRRPRRVEDGILGTVVDVTTSPQVPVQATQTDRAA